MSTKNNIIRITTISGVEAALFDDFKDFGFDIKHFEEGPKASYYRDIIDFIVVSTVCFPYQFVLSLLEDKIKSADITKKAFKVWKVFMDSEHKPALIASGKTIIKEPCIRLEYQISEKESTSIEIKGSFSEEFFERIIKKHLKLVKKKAKNRAKEDKIDKRIEDLWSEIKAK